MLICILHKVYDVCDVFNVSFFISCVIIPAMLIGIDASHAAPPAHRHRDLFPAPDPALIRLGVRRTAFGCTPTRRRPHGCSRAARRCRHVNPLHPLPAAVDASPPERRDADPAARRALRAGARAAADPPAAQRGHRARPGLSALSRSAPAGRPALPGLVHPLERAAGDRRAG